MCSFLYLHFRRKLQWWKGWVSWLVCVRVCVCEGGCGLAIAPIDKRQMDLHGSAYSDWVKKGQRECRGWLLFSSTTAAENKDLSLTSGSSWSFEKVQPGILKPFSKQVHTHTCSLLQIRK